MIDVFKYLSDKKADAAKHINKDDSNYLLNDPDVYKYEYPRDHDTLLDEELEYG